VRAESFASAARRKLAALTAAIADVLAVAKPRGILLCPGRYAERRALPSLSLQDLPPDRKMIFKPENLVDWKTQSAKMNARRIGDQ